MLESCIKLRLSEETELDLMSEDMSGIERNQEHKEVRYETLGKKNKYR
jgi:hypothetical protein